MEELRCRKIVRQAERDAASESIQRNGGNLSANEINCVIQTMASYAKERGIPFIADTDDCMMKNNIQICQPIE